MSDSQTPDASAIASAYVREMLELNPVSQSAHIIRRRRELWRPNEKPRNPATQVTDSSTAIKLRERAKQCLDALQQSFYQLPAEKIEQYLRFLEQDRLPEFAVQAARFRDVFRYRDALIQLDRELPDRKFAFSLLGGLIRPAAEAGALHEQYIESVRRERRVDTAIKMTEDLLQRYPALYELEKGWFDSIRETRARSMRFLGQESSSPLRIVVTVVIVLIIGGAAIVADSTNPRHKSQPKTYTPPARPAYQPPSVYPKSVQTPAWAPQSTGTYPTPKSPETVSEIIERTRRESERSRQEMEARFRELSQPPTYDPPLDPFAIPETSIPSLTPPAGFNSSRGNDIYQRSTTPSTPSFN